MIITRTVTPPAEDPVSIFEAISHLRVDLDEEDGLIASLISAATQMVEKSAAIALVDRTVEIVCTHTHPLPLAPLREVVEVKHKDEVLADYAVYPGTPGMIVPAVSWPTPVTIQAVFGFGGAEQVPQMAKQAILLMLGHWYEHREAVTSAGTPKEVPMAAQALIDLLRWSHYS